MKTIFLTVFSIIFFACSGLINAQVDTVKLRFNNANLVESASFNLVVSPGDFIVFESISGNFAIYIPDAYEFLKIGQANLDVLVSDSNPISETYEVYGPSGEWPPKTFVYWVYSIGNNKWPDSPPRIIVVK